MKFQQHHWTRLEKGSTVVVTLNKSANVRLMNSTNFNNYKNNRRHSYNGGLVKKSPFRIVVPSTGSWYLTIDRFGLKQTGTLSMKVDVEPPALPTARQARPAALAAIRHEAPVNLTPDDDGRTWDVFISHASEDKDEVANPLELALMELGLTAWLDKSEIRIGDSLRRKIDYGLAHSSFGVVVFSKPFFAKGWTNYELDGIVGQAVEGTQRLLPIWHNISRDEVQKHSPSLADKLARSTDTNTIAEIAAEIAEVVNEASAETDTGQGL